MVRVARRLMPKSIDFQDAVCPCSLIDEWPELYEYVAADAFNFNIIP